MTIHNKLPDERPSIIHKFTVAGLEGYATVSCYDDGTPAELFLTVHQVGGLERGMASALAITISMALQHGVPMAKITEKLRGMSFEPQGPTSNKAIPWAKSLADYLGRWLEMRFPTKAGEPKMTNELLELKAKLAEFTTLMSCGHAQVFLDPVEGTCDACTERDRVKRLEEAVLFTRQFLDKLERGTEPDDPLYKARRQYHAPLHAKLDAALSQDVEGANAGTTLSIEAAAREVDRLNYEAYPGPGFGEKFNTALVELHQAVSTKSTLHLIKEQKTLLEPVWPRPAGYKED